MHLNIIKAAMEINNSVTQSHSNKSFSFTKKTVLSWKTINLLLSFRIANRIIRFIKAAINLWNENNMQKNLAIGY